MGGTVFCDGSASFRTEKKEQTGDLNEEGKSSKRFVFHLSLFFSYPCSSVSRFLRAICGSKFFYGDLTCTMLR
jgi:hypothetical protein